MPAEASDLELLLRDADERAPVLAAGLPEASLQAAPAPERGPQGKDSLHLEDLAGDPNDLAAQRWAVIAPEGPAGDELLAAIAALIDLRRDQQGADPIVHRVPAGMDAAAAMRWKHEVLRAEDVPADERPRYLLIVGDLDRVSLELQHVLANGSFVGRLHCPSARGYRAYAEKVVARERGPLARRARALYYTVQDGSAAIAAGHRHLISPSLRMTADLAARGKLAVDGPTEIPHSEWGPDELLGVAATDTPSLLVSLSHGLGAPRRGWKSVDHQRALQGALSLGSEDPLSADMVRSARFLPGGVWLCVACYGAGTPPTSAFHPWLARLTELGRSPEAAAAVLRALPRDGERPFVAALPQALLANPSGPLAIVGHMDLAWTFGFTDPSGKHSRASRMHAAQRALAGGNRAGVGLDALMHAYREVNDELMARYQTRREAQARGQADPVDPRQLGDAWMQRNDLRGYVLLGDPAARLGVTSGSSAPRTEASELSDRARPPPKNATIELDARVHAPNILRTAPTESAPTNEQSTTAGAANMQSVAPVQAQSAATTPTNAQSAAPDGPPANVQSAMGPSAVVTSSPTSVQSASPASPPATTPSAGVTSSPTNVQSASPASPPATTPSAAVAGQPVNTQSVTPASPPATTPSAAVAGQPVNTQSVTPAAPASAQGMTPADRPTHAHAGARPASAASSQLGPVPSSFVPSQLAPPPVAAPSPPPSPPSRPEVAMSTSPPPEYHPPAPQGAAPSPAIVRPRMLENPDVGLRERAVLAMLRGDEAPRSIAVRFGLPLEEVFYWLDVYREAGRRALGL
ncbi:MAG: hypothetical protein JNL82_37565 [Myxococcales bacterium]|nr:hypothetical protein [Myxococcales bacterium]